MTRTPRRVHVPSRCSRPRARPRSVRRAAIRTGPAAAIPAVCRGGTGYWVIALTSPKASRPFVVTCPDCGRRCRVDSALPEDELRQLDLPSA